MRLRYWLPIIVLLSAAVRAETPWDVKHLSEPPKFEWVDGKSPVRSLMYVGEPYNGKPTHVFAYYATPGTLAGDTSKDHNLPAMVLVHGGGGTAFAEWAELWAKRGYAAIAMDLAGYRPNEGQNPHQGKNRTRLPDGGPDQGDNEKFGSVDKAPGEQWPYHAVANVVLAHSLIRSFKEVDANRTGLTGISWGGYLTCITAGVDSRFKAAVPVYGCGFLHENSVWLPRFAQFTPEQRQRWVSLWDPSQYLPHVSMPIFFLDGTNDFAYPLDSSMKSVAAVPDSVPKTVRIQVKMPHGHQVGWAPQEIGLFIDSVLIGGDPLPKLGTPEVGDGRVRLAVMSRVKLTKAEMHLTTDETPINKREWQTVAAEVKATGDGAYEVTCPAPPGDATVWFLAVTDERGAMVTTRVTITK
ncbi:MAG: prolyl oligopeptidase family serine peptidase [Phycisphaera sp.]|nr:prolyl oligopeptidase family serine peptidase [Phycisphaera sp.]